MSAGPHPEAPVAGPAPDPGPGSPAVDTSDDERPGPGVRATLASWWRAHPRAVLATAAALAGGIAWAAWTAARLGDPAVTWQVYGYRVASDSLTRVTVLVTREPGAEVVCRVKALDAGFGEVGSVDVRVPPGAAGSARTVRVSVDVPTARASVTGTVDTCVTR